MLDETYHLKIKTPNLTINNSIKDQQIEILNKNNETETIYFTSDENLKNFQMEDSTV